MFRCVLLVACVFPVGAFGEGLILNEIVASNHSGITEQTGRHCDWIEIRNRGSEPASLWEPHQLALRCRGTTWPFPQGAVIPPDGYLVVLADGTEVPFRLSAAGGEVALVDLTEGGSVLDRVEFPALGRDIAYGRVPGDVERWSVLGTPTPGLPNHEPEPIRPQVSIVGQLPLKPRLSDAVHVFLQVWDDGPVSPQLRVLSSQGAEIVVPARPAGTGNPLVYRAEIPPQGGGTVYYKAEANDGELEGSDPEDGTWPSYSVGEAPPAVVINEVMADNDTVLADSGGRFQDWIELFNRTDQTVRLDGYALTDDLRRDRPWSFPPGVSIPAHGHVIVFCDGKPELTRPGEVHASFRLAESESFPKTWDDEIFLLAPNGGVVDAIAFRGEKTDTSIGRFPDGRDLLIHMASTPGGSNRVETDMSVFGEHHVSLLINEVAADNWSHFSESCGSFSDWVEILNVGSADVDLSGMKLGDADFAREAWTIPEGTLVRAGDYEVFYCDGASENGPGHTSFRLSRNGDVVVLLDRENRVIDGIRFGAQPQDMSLGRAMDGSVDLSFLEPTPGAPNRPPQRDFVRGDVNLDGRVDLSDPVAILGSLFLGAQGPACPKAADVDDDSVIDISDAAMVLEYLFRGGPAPAPPFPDLGQDPTPDDGLQCPGGF